MASVLALVVQSIGLHQVVPHLWWAMGGYGIATLLVQLSGSLSQFFWMRMRYVSDNAIYGNFLKRMAEIDIPYHEDPTFQSTVKRVEDALAWRVMGMLNNVSKLVTNALGALTMIGILLTLDWWVLLAVLAPVIIDYLINTHFWSDIWGIWMYKGDERKEADHALDGFKHKEIVQEAKIYGFGHYLAKKYNDANTSFIAAVVGKINKKYFWLTGNSIISVGISLGIQILLILKTIAGTITLQSYVFYVQSLEQIAGLFQGIQINISEIYEYGLYVRDAKDLFELPDKIDKSKSIMVVEDTPPTIEFRNVSFSYPSSESPVIEHLSFTIKPGERIALVWENGAGKSTIIKLLARFYDVTSGEILVNGVNIKEIDLKSYYKLWWVLFQYFARYWFTVRENIALGNLDFINDKERLERAIEKGDARELIDGLPKKEDTMLSTDFPQGVDLSGGGWQKIGIARGMFAEPRLIVLDEPTSALDALAEARVFEHIHSVAEGMTMLMVSHRFSTVRKADRIIVLEHGRIVEHGTHDELMTKNGLYHEMFETQAEWYR